MPSPPASVKSDSPSRPGSWRWRKMTSHSGPCSARQARMRRSSVRRSPSPRSRCRREPLLEDRHRPQPRRGLEQRHDLLLEDALERVGPAPPPRRLLRRGRARVSLQAVARGRAEPGLGRSDRDRVGRTMRHEKASSGDRSRGGRARALLTMEKAPLYLGRSRSPGTPPTADADAGRPRPPVGPRPPFATGRPAPSHRDCRAEPHPVCRAAPSARAASPCCASTSRGCGGPPDRAGPHAIERWSGR